MQPCLHPATMRPGLSGPEIVRIGSHAGFHLMEASARSLITFVADDPNRLRALLSEYSVTPIHCGWSAGLRSSRDDFAAALPRTAEEMAFVAAMAARVGRSCYPSGASRAFLTLMTPIR
jgi:hypothetical protein